MDKNKITIDLDLTTVPSDKTWFEWLKSCSTVFYEDSYNHDLLNEQVDYFLPTYFELIRRFYSITLMSAPFVDIVLLNCNQYCIKKSWMT